MSLHTGRTWAAAACCDPRVPLYMHYIFRWIRWSQVRVGIISHTKAYSGLPNIWLTNACALAADATVQDNGVTQVRHLGGLFETGVFLDGDAFARRLRGDIQRQHSGVLTCIACSALGRAAAGAFLRQSVGLALPFRINLSCFRPFAIFVSCLRRRTRAASARRSSRPASIRC